MEDKLSDEMMHATTVVVAGAGPAGLTTAITLARQGVEVLVVERRAGLGTLPRATGVSLRTMELLRSWGIEDAVRAGAADVEWLLWRGETLRDEGQTIHYGWPTREQAALISPTQAACVPQDHLEPVLLEHLRSLPRAEVWFGAEVRDVEQRPDRVRVVLGDGRAVEAAYLVGADGGRSRVRRALGIAMHGPDRLEAAISALFHAPMWDYAGTRRYGGYGITHPEADGILLPAGPGDRWIYGKILEPGARPEHFDAARLARLIAVAAGDPGLRPRIERIGAFSFAAQVAERFRAGRVFLTGDAAHRVTPRGGTGMNTAIRSGHDLGWKLAWVLRGWAGEDLLDTYESDRRPVAEHNARRSADADATIRYAAEALRADIGDRIAHHWVAPGVSTLDLLGDGLTLFTGPDGAPADVVSRAPVVERRLDALTARALGIRPGGALLVRPDGAPARWLASPCERAVAA